MDCYKILELITPSLLTGGTIVIGAYLGYFKKKFKTYGDIEGKLEKLPKLSEIEHAIASAKNSSEFEYHIRKEKLIHFEALVKKMLSMNSFLMNYFKQVSINANRFSIKIAKIPEYFTYDNYEKDTYQSDDFYERIDEIELSFKMYIEVIGNEKFNSSFETWLKGINEIYGQSIDCQDLIHEVIVKNQYGDNPQTNEESTRIINGLALELRNRVDKSKVFSDSRQTLFKECGELSREMEKHTSHNADYV